MKRKDFFLELGTEEIPAGYLKPAIKTLERFFVGGLSAAKLSFEEVTVFSTPRRLGIHIKQIQTAQADETIERVGPALNIAFDDNGNLTNAGKGFLKGAKAAEEDIFFIPSPKGEKIAIKKQIEGKQANEVLQKITTTVTSKISFPKSMRWGNNKFTFARPIRWIMSLWDDELLDVEVCGIRAAKYSLGNRFIELENRVDIPSFSKYEDLLEKAFVIPNRDKRKIEIEKQMTELFTESSYKIIKDDNLLEIVTDLVEYPTAVIAEFDSKYLSLPKKVITSTLSQHQKYFSVEDENGDLTNKFVFISNGDPVHSDLIKLGNEKVIKARLDDADFYFQEDTKIQFEKYVDGLVDVTFQEKLGTLYEKTQRIESLSEFIADDLKLKDVHNIKRAARLCKADLVTLMLGEKEFTKLQGYIGNIYAAKSGEDQNVCDAIEEHYLPRGENDMLPETEVSAVVAIADKLDTVCGIIGIGMMPSSSKDPFALRRAANGIVQIIDKFNFQINIHSIIVKSFEILSTKVDEQNIDSVKTFFKQRMNWLLKIKAIDYDVIESVMHIEQKFIIDAVKRANALQKYKESSSFQKLVIGFKRVSNIISEITEFQEVDQTKLSEKAELQLYNEYNKLAVKINELLLEKEFEKIMNELVQFGKFIDAFFDDIMVNVEDKILRTNRYNLLMKIRELFLTVADLDKIVVEK